MLRDKRILWVLAALVVVAVAVNVRHFATKDTGLKAPMQTAQFAPYQESTAPPSLPSHRRTASVSVAKMTATHPIGPGARNPFMTRGEQYGGKFGPASAEKDSLGTSGPRLGGITIIGGRKAALLDGEPVLEGDRLGDIRVHKIHDDFITLARGSHVWHLTLPVHPEGAVPAEEAP